MKMKVKVKGSAVNALCCKMAKTTLTKKDPGSKRRFS